MGIILLFVWILLLKLVGMEEYDLLQRESAVWEFFVLLLVCTGYGEILGLAQTQMLQLGQRGVSVLESIHLSLLRNITCILLYNILSLN